jgi:hypothetical protein
MRYAAQSKEIGEFEIFGLAYLRNLGIFDCELSPKICRFNKICTPTFANLPSLSTILAAKLPLVHLELSIFPQIVEKFKTALMGYSGAWGKLIHEKIEIENLVALSL